MKKGQEKYVCALCDQTVGGKLEGDICPIWSMTYWKCYKCEFLIRAPKPLDVCPKCGENCGFIDVTCYTPECGGPGQIGSRL